MKKHIDLFEFSEVDISKLKETQIELLLELKKFCDSNNITFYLFAGTLLGAIRHKGFIPWDDDIDICMPFEDYQKFLSLYKSNEKYFLQTSETDKGYFYSFGKLRKNNTEYNELITSKLGSHNGIFIDIFPVSGYPSTFFGRFHFKFWVFCLNKRSYPLKFIKDKKVKYNFSYHLMSIITWVLLWWCPFNKAARLRDKFIRKHQYPKSDLCFCGNNYKQIYKKNFFTGKRLVEFEGYKMPSMAKPDDYLTFAYGNYMELPPIDKRVSHHNCVNFKS